MSIQSWVFIAVKSAQSALATVLHSCWTPDIAFGLCFHLVAVEVLKRPTFKRAALTEDTVLEFG